MKFIRKKQGEAKHHREMARQAKALEMEGGRESKRETMVIGQEGLISRIESVQEDAVEDQNFRRTATIRSGSKDANAKPRLGKAVGKFSNEGVQNIVIPE